MRRQSPDFTLVKRTMPQKHRQVVRPRNQQSAVPNTQPNDRIAFDIPFYAGSEPEQLSGKAGRQVVLFSISYSICPRPKSCPDHRDDVMVVTKVMSRKNSEIDFWRTVFLWSVCNQSMLLHRSTEDLGSSIRARR